MDKQQIATSHDFDTTSEDFGEEGYGHDPDDLIRAKQAMAKLSAELGEPLDPRWFLTTAYLKQLTLSHRARARQALRWRPKFLSALAASCSFTFAARAAGVAYNTFLFHQRNDPEFARQVAEAEEEASDRLHSVCFKVALEGQLQPIYFQGKVVGHFRKFDSRLAIELLRAHMPDVFRTPGAKVNVSAGNQLAGGNNVIFDGPMIQRLQAMRQESLRRIAEKKAQGREVEIKPPNGGLIGGTVPPAGVPPAT